VTEHDSYLEFNQYTFVIVFQTNKFIAKYM